jgi:hypothetical protein
VQNTLESSAAVFARTPRRAAAERLLALFQVPEAQRLFREAGLEPVKFPPRAP